MGSEFGEADMIDLEGVEGWFSWPAYYEQIYDSLLPNSRVFEIGVYEGRSTLFFADLIRSGGKPIEFHYYDLFELNKWAKNKDYPKKFFRNLERFGLGDYVTPHTGNSSEILAGFEDAYFDFIYIDGNHRCIPVKEDILVSLKKLKKRGRLAGHDINLDIVKCGLVSAGVPWRELGREKNWNVWQANLEKLI
jgi:hypothetical protein